METMIVFMLSATGCDGAVQCGRDGKSVTDAVQRGSDGKSAMDAVR